MAATGKVKRSNELPRGVERLKEEHRKVVKDCSNKTEHWKKVEKDYESLQDRLRTLPDKLSYDIMVPFGPLAFMPGKLVHTNELTVLLGDNWFAKCSAKQADALVEHRKKHVNKTLDDLQKVMKNFQNRASFTDDLKKLAGRADGTGDFVDIREEVVNEEEVTKGKHRLAHKRNSKPKQEFVLELNEENDDDKEDGVLQKGLLSEEELWARLDELECQEEMQDERYRLDSTDTNGEDTTSSSSEEEKETEDGSSVQHNGHQEENGWVPTSQTNGTNISQPEVEEEDNCEEETRNGLPTIYFSHTVEPKKVRINTGKNTTLKFSERKEQKEQAKRKKKNGKSNGHSFHENYKITTPTDIYRVFVDSVNGELMPRKSILKSRSRENSVCSDTSESSAADFEERRTAFGRALSHDETTHSDTSDGITEEESPTGIGPHSNGRFEAFTGTVIEKDPLPSSIPHLTICPPALPTIPERKLEEQGQEVPQEPPKRVSKFKATRLQQK